MRKLQKSDKLANVCYDIRGPVLEVAKKLESEGNKIVKLNTGNPALFDFFAPDDLVQNIINNHREAQAYSDSKGIMSARDKIFENAVAKGLNNVDVDHIYTGNGVSELITMSMQALLNNGDEILIPSPDYPLWTAAVNISGGKAVHYICDETSEWNPDINDIKSKITPKTRGIVVINPNNPTGALYPDELLNQIIQIARENDLIIFADEIYEQLIYDGGKHTPIASLADDILFLTFNGLSKSHRVAGFRVGWMIISGDKTGAKEYIDGINIVAGMRLCSNVLGQHAISVSLNENPTMDEYLAPNGRLTRQRDISYKMINDIPGVSAVKPKAAFYMFPKIDINKFGIKDDEKFVLDLLVDKKVLLVQGRGFNWKQPDHFRLIFLPKEDVLKRVLVDIKDFMASYQQTK